MSASSKCTNIRHRIRSRAERCRIKAGAELRLFSPRYIGRSDYDLLQRRIQLRTKENPLFSRKKFIITEYLVDTVHSPDHRTRGWLLIRQETEFAASKQTLFKFSIQSISNSFDYSPGYYCTALTAYIVARFPLPSKALAHD